MVLKNYQSYINIGEKIISVISIPLNPTRNMKIITIKIFVTANKHFSQF